MTTQGEESDVSKSDVSNVSNVSKTQETAERKLAGQGCFSRIRKYFYTYIQTYVYIRDDLLVIPDVSGCLHPWILRIRHIAQPQEVTK